MIILTFIRFIIFALSIQLADIDLYALTRFIVYKIQVLSEFYQKLISHSWEDGTEAHIASMTFAEPYSF